MEAIRKAVYVRGKAVYNVETMLVVGHRQQHGCSRRHTVPPTLVDEYGCFGKGDMCMLGKCLRVCASTSTAPDVVLVDAGELLHHVVWPVIGIAEDWLQASALDCPTTIPFPIVFIIQYATNTKDHQRTRRRITKTDSEHTPSLSIYCTPQYHKQEPVQRHPIWLPSSMQHPACK